MARTPTYVVIAEELRRRIEMREVSPGGRLPSERELVEEFGVARMTVRHALDLLQAESMIERRRGRAGGTFARALPPVVDLCGPRGLLDQLAQAGAEVSSHTLFDGHRTPPRAAALAFRCARSEAVPVREILHYADGVPAILETIFVCPGHSGPAPAFESTLRCASETPAARGCEDIITPSIASDEERERLCLDHSAPLQRITRLIRVGGELAAYALIVLRPDAALVRVTM